MKRLIVLSPLIGILSLSGCMTMDMLSHSKDEFKQGNYGAGAFSGASSLIIGPILDIFTLGGTLSAEESQQVWTDTAKTYSDGKKRNQAIKQQQATLSAQQQYGSTYTPQATYSNNQRNNASYENTNSSNTRMDRKKAAALNNCLSVDNTSNQLASFLVNRCSQKIWVSWRDQGYCKSGCGEDVEPNSKDSITKIKGTFEAAVCPHLYGPYVPNAPSPTNYRWVSGSFECVQW